MRMFDEVVVHTRTGKSLRGVVRRSWGRWVVLSNAELVEVGGTVELDGDVLIPRDNIDFGQRTTKGGIA